jgi:crossover junction endodeoxyribonuclease RuvC
MTTLGIDPGYGRIGFAFVARNAGMHAVLECGLVETPATLSFVERLAYLYDRIDALIARHAPKESAVERLFFSKNAKTAIDVAQARGVICLALARRGIPVYEYAPNEVKSAVTGSGAASKSQVKKMLSIILPHEKKIRYDDVSDALAVAVCHINRQSVLSRLPRVSP